MTVTSLTSDGRYLTMNITTDSKISIAEMIMQLKQISSLTDVNVASLIEEEDENSGNQLVTFAVTCVYKPFAAFEDETETDLQIREDAAEGTEGAASTNDTTNTTDTKNTVGEGTANE